MMLSMSERFGAQPSFARAFAADATSTGGSPSRSGPVTKRTGAVLTRSTAAITSRTLVPVSVPRLNTSDAPPASRWRKASTWASARSADVDIVADASAIRRGEIVAEHGKLAVACAGGGNRQRDQVRLGLMPLADFPCGIGTRRVEIAQCHRAQAVGMAKIGKHPFDHQLGGAIRIDRRLRRRPR